jgi:hypothetical protein
VGVSLAKRGLDLLSGVFASAADKGSEIAADVVDKQVKKVAEKIKEKTGIEIGDIAEDKLTEEQWRQLKEFELQEQELLLESRAELSALELEREKAYLLDRQNARAEGGKRDQSDDKFIRRFTYYYAYLITAVTFLFILTAIIVPAYFNGKNGEDAFPQESWHVINTVVGFLLGVGLSAVIQYFYGSSMGSKNKERMIENLPMTIGGRRQ